MKKTKKVFKSKSTIEHMQHKIIGMVIFILVIASALFLVSQRPAITGGVVQENIKEVAPEVIAKEEVQQEVKKDTTQDLIYFAKKTIDEHFPDSKGAFIKSDSCPFEGCVSWLYPQEKKTKNKLYFNIYDFQERSVPVELLIDSKTNKTIRELANGKITLTDYEEDFGDLPLKHFETAFLCKERHWIEIGIDKTTFQKFSEKEQIMEVTNDILAICNKNSISAQP